MSRRELTSCDVCGAATAAPRTDKWYRLQQEGLPFSSKDQWDICSYKCLAAFKNSEEEEERR
jgi:hypothetical protein